MSDLISQPTRLMDRVSVPPVRWCKSTLVNMLASGFMLFTSTPWILFFVTPKESGDFVLQNHWNYYFSLFNKIHTTSCLVNKIHTTSYTQGLASRTRARYTLHPLGLRQRDRLHTADQRRWLQHGTDMTTPRFLFDITSLLQHVSFSYQNVKFL